MTAYELTRYSGHGVRDIQVAAGISYSGSNHERCITDSITDRYELACTTL